jgi:hypothetical protein
MNPGKIPMDRTKTVIFSVGGSCCQKLMRQNNCYGSGGTNAQCVQAEKNK